MSNREAQPPSKRTTPPVAAMSPGSNFETWMAERSAIQKSANGAAVSRHDLDTILQMVQSLSGDNLDRYDDRSLSSDDDSGQNEDDDKNLRTGNEPLHASSYSASGIANVPQSQDYQNTNGTDTARHRFVGKKNIPENESNQTKHIIPARTTSAPTRQSNSTAVKTDSKPEMTGMQSSDPSSQSTMDMISENKDIKMETPIIRIPGMNQIYAEGVQPETPATRVTPAPPLHKPSHKIDPLAPTTAAPYGYKIVRVRRLDGSIAKVKRPLKEGETVRAISLQQENTTETPVKREAGSRQPVSHVSTDLASTSPTTTAPQENVCEKEISVDDSARNPTQVSKDHSTTRGIQISEKEIEQPIDILPQSSMEKDPLLFTRKLARTMQLVAWFVMITFPLLFLALGITTVVLRNHEVADFDAINFDSANSDKLSKAVTIAASTWPIIFAAIIAQTLKMYAAYRVESGIRMMTLEQLISSHSVGGALKQPFTLRTINWTTMLLIIIWSLSPLAGQAMLRMFAIVGNTPEDYNGKVEYWTPLDNNWSRANSMWSQSSYSEPALDYIYPVFNNLLFSYSRIGQAFQDPWGNLKAPLPIDDNSTLTYPSLVGTPVWITLPENSTETPNFQSIYSADTPDTYTKFSLRTSYFKLDCSNFIVLREDDPEVKTYQMNLTPDISLHLTAENSTGADENLSPSEIEPGSNGTLHFGSRMTSFKDPRYTDTVEQIYYSKCAYWPVTVETQWECIYTEDAATCGPINNGKNITELHPSDSPLGYWFPWAVRSIAAATDGGGPGLSMIERFLSDPNFGLQNFTKLYETSKWGLMNLTGPELSDRLGLAINTLWLLGSASDVPYLYFGHESNNWQLDNGVKSISALQTRPTIYLYEVYIPWAGTLIACSALLFIAAVAGAIWEARLIGPEFLGFANTAVRHNVKMPKDLSLMNARDRLLHLRECDVLLQDAKPKAPIGKIVLGVKDAESQRLVPGRQYR